MGREGGKATGSRAGVRGKVRTAGPVSGLADPRSSKNRLCMTRRGANEISGLFQSWIRQAVPLDVHGSSADEGSGVKLGKLASRGMPFASLDFNYERPV